MEGIDFAQKAMEGTGSGFIGGAAIMFSLYVVGKLVDEVFRYKGMRSNKEAKNGASGLTEDEHKWLQDMRDDIRGIKESLKRIEG